jgi:phenylpropionate dioxygenase-like ring-hydroxylating dioxygenase large terminal subunit
MALAVNLGSQGSAREEPLAKPGKYDGLVLADGRVHRSLYTDPGIFDEEMLKIFGGSWVFLLHEAEIPRPNDFKQVTVGRRPTIVARTAEGRIVAMLNRCTHRGSPVCIDESGNARNFVCPYHNWTFSNAGELISVPFPDGYGPDFDFKSRHLGRFPRLESYRGFVFASLNADVEPLAAWLGPAGEVIDWAVDKDDIGPAGVRVVKGAQMVYRGNWKHQNDNNADGYHTPFLHKSMNAMNRVRHGGGKWLSHVADNTPMVCQYLGNGHKLGDHRPAVRSPWEQARPMPGRETHGAAIAEKVGAERAPAYLDLTGRSGINLVIYPNLFILGHGSFAVYEPVKVDETNVRYYTTLINDAPDELNTLRIRFEEDFNNIGGRDDFAIMEMVQEVLTTVPEMEWLDLSRGMVRQTVDARGVITSNKTDDTAIRGSYQHWKTLMTREVTLAAV